MPGPSSRSAVEEFLRKKHERAAEKPSDQPARQPAPDDPRFAQVANAACEIVRRELSDMVSEIRAFWSGRPRT